MATDEPLLLIAFNRPDDLARLIDRLRDVAPSRVFVAVDGPREGNARDAETVARTHDAVSAIDWPCEVTTLFREENLGCGRAVSSAITWFLDHVERGIILEDDLLPDPSFFPYCTELLDRYENDDRVLAVSGCNYVPPSAISAQGAYRFSQVPHIWGWATWRRSWTAYRLDITGWRAALPFTRRWRAMGGSPASVAYWSTLFDLLARRQIDTWDGQLVFAAMRTGMLTATPNVNLVENTGFGADATHTVRRPDYIRPVQSIALPLAQVDVAIDESADRWTRRHVFEATIPGMARQAARYVRRRRGRSA